MLDGHRIATSEYKLVCAFCLFECVSSESASKMYSNGHPNPQFHPDHPSANCKKDLRRINLQRLAEFESENSKLSNLIRQKNEALNLMGKRFNELGHAINKSLSLCGDAELRDLLTGAKRIFNLRRKQQVKLVNAELKRMERQLGEQTQYVARFTQLRRELEKKRNFWNEHRVSDKLRNGFNVESDLVPYPNSEELSGIYTCQRCRSAVTIFEVLPKPADYKHRSPCVRISPHINPSSEECCMNSLCQLTQRDLRSLSSNVNLDSNSIDLRRTRDEVRAGEPG